MENMLETWDAPASLTESAIDTGLASNSPITAPSILLKPTHVLEVAMHAFGDLSTAEAWLNEPHARLGGTPTQQCQLPGGQDRVLQLLCAISGGTEP